LKNLISIEGKSNIIVLDEKGNLKQLVESENLVVTNGLNHVIDMLGSSPGSYMLAMAIGTGTTAPTSGNTALQNEISRKSATIAESGKNIRYTGVWSPADLSSVSITEAGIFNHASSGQGVMFARQTPSAINLGTNDNVTMNWDFTFNAA